MKTVHLYFFASAFIIAFISCTKTPSDQRQTENKCLADLSVSTGGNGLNSKNVYVYDGEDRLIETKYFRDYVPNGRTEYKYGADGRITTITQYNATGAKSEEKQFTYNAQGRVAGYDLITYLPYSTPVKKVNYVYEENKLTQVGIGDAGTISEQKRFFENGNEVRGEFWAYGQLVSVDTVEYGSQVYKHHWDENAALAVSGTILSKNLHTRRKSFNKVQNKYTYDDNYVFVLDAQGYQVRYTTTTNIPLPPQAPVPVPVTVETIYKCN